MSIDTYANVMIRLYIGSFLLSIFIGIVSLWKGIKQKKSIRHWAVIPCLICYSYIAQYNVFVPYIAYDDLADPNYWQYKGWRLQDFIFNDIRLLLVWLFIGALFDFIAERRKYKESIQKAYIVVLIFFSGGCSGSAGLVVCERPSEVHIVVRENGYAYVCGGKIEIGAAIIPQSIYMEKAVSR